MTKKKGKVKKNATKKKRRRERRAEALQQKEYAQSMKNTN
jgi:hypothetical protein